MEKQKKQLLQEEEELHEQVAHSQEIIEKLTDVEDELKEQLDAEIKDKEYLQEMLDETGNILYQLKNNEQKLLKDKDILLDDLEQEVEVRCLLHLLMAINVVESIFCQQFSYDELPRKLLFGYIYGNNYDWLNENGIHSCYKTNVYRIGYRYMRSNVNCNRVCDTSFKIGGGGGIQNPIAHHGWATKKPR